MKRKLSLLFKNLCCSICKHEFDEDSFVIKRDEQGLLVTTLQCQNCGKNYGVAFLGFFHPDGATRVNYQNLLGAFFVLIWHHFYLC